MRSALVFLLFFVVACNGPSVPDDVLPPEKMEKVLYDVIRADEMVDFLRFSDSAWQPFSRRTSLYDTVLQLHEIKKEQFQRSLAYYQGRPDLLKEILEGLQQKVTDTTAAVNRQLRAGQQPPAQ